MLVSPHGPLKVFETLKREIDRPPSLWRSLITLNVHYFSGTAPVCGTVHERGFELRSRRGPAFSLRAKGSVRETHGGTEIAITFFRPVFPDIAGLLFRRYERDRETIVGFLKQRLHAEEHA